MTPSPDEAMRDSERLDWLERCWVRVQAGAGLDAIMMQASPPQWPYPEHTPRDWLTVKPAEMPLRQQIDLAAKRMPKP